MDNSTLEKFPFKTVLSFRLLIKYWEEQIQNGSFPAFTQSFLDYLDKAPELKQPIEDISILEKHRPFINFLMSAVIPTANTDTDLVAAMPPFRFDVEKLLTTRAFDAAIDLETFEAQAVANLPGGKMSLGKIIKAGLLILEKFHKQQDISNQKPVLVTLRHPKTGLDRVYKVEINNQFCEIIQRGENKEIDKNVLKFLIEKIHDTDLWLQYIRPENYEFQGFLVIRLVDVTEQEMLSSIKYDLLERNAVVRQESFARIQHKLRSLFNIQEIRLGIAYFDPNNNLILNNADSDCWRSLTEGEMSAPCEDYSGSLYERAWMEKRYITIENLNDYPFRSKAEEMLLANGIKNVLLAPLLDEGEAIGMLELATFSPGKLDAVSAQKVESVLPMFTAAVKRVKEEMSTEVRAIIQEECTAIHPAVQWRFFEAGANLMNKRRRGEKASLEEIVFKDVYPLYGMADVRNSSIERNAAIQKDLQQNLRLAKDLLQKIYTLKKLPLLEETMFKTDEHLERINQGLASGDESNVLDFLKTEINPLIQHFENEDELRKHIVRYRSLLDPVFGVVYKRRKAFEESLDLINKTISSYLEEAEQEAQQMFPHYFEKYKTDGVEFTMYLGSSLVKNRKFDVYNLKNFRLWQLLVMAEINRRIEGLRSKMKTTLEITQLILVHDQPISIRFRSDEKQFDVDGAYDIRYEIMKKRIDKAHIKATGERLTQPGTIAIVYNQAKVEDEYRRYFHYLKAKNLIEGDAEEVELEELPGANGLRALRVKLTQEKRTVSIEEKDDLLKDIQEALRLQ